MPPSSGRAVVLYINVRAVSDPLADERPCNGGHGSGEVEIPGRSLRSLALFIAKIRFFPRADPFYIRVRVPCLCQFDLIDSVGLFSCPDLDLRTSRLRYHC
jgi:hypothetical protein